MWEARSNRIRVS
ncbi:hypothetical protein RDABS01_026790 [Bienertia sinuspersici]